MPTACEHQRTELIARQSGVEYLRCLDCDQVFEAEDLEVLTAAGDTDDE